MKYFLIIFLIINSFIVGYSLGNIAGTNYMTDFCVEQIKKLETSVIKD